MFKLTHTALLLGAIIFISPTSYAANINAPNASPTQSVTARGILRAVEKTEIAAPMTGRLLDTRLKSGQYFKNQALMARFDCEALNAQHKATLKAAETLEVKYEIAAELLELGAAGTLETSLAHSEMEQALAEVDIIKTRLKDCHISAPYNGYVTEHHVSAHETVQTGQVLYSIQRAGALELSLIIPAQWTAWIDTGQVFTFTIDETGEVFKAKVTRIDASVDPVSQTLKIHQNL